MVCEQFALSPSLVCVTPGETDTFSEIQFDTQTVPHERLADVTLLEARLRQAQKVDLKELAATLVIAFNEASRSLVVVSNQELTTEALQQAAHFKWKTNMKVRLVDGGTFSFWVKKNLQSLTEKYSKELLDLVLKVPRKRETRIVRIKAVLGSHQYSTLGLKAPLRDASIHLGWVSGEQMAPCELVMEPGEKEIDPAKHVMGAAHRRHVGRLTHLLTRPREVVAIKGPAGIGKSTISHAALATLAARDIPFTIIDVRQILTSRHLFWALLTALSGVDHRLPIGGADSPSALLEFLATRHVVSEKMLAAVGSVLDRGRASFDENRDFNEQLLLDYLETASAPHALRRPSVLAFEALNASTPETLEFLNMVVRRLSNLGYTILLELRDFGAVHFSEEQWDGFVRLFEANATAGVLQVEPFSERDALDYLTQQLPGLGKRAQLIVKRVGRVPLFLRSAAIWIRERGVVSSSSGGHVVVEDLETFFGGISPENCLEIINRLIRHWRDQGDLPYKDCLAATDLLDGYLDLEVLAALAPHYDALALAEKLQETGLFHASFDVASRIEVSHELVLDCIHDINEKHPFSKQKVARDLLPLVNELAPDDLTRSLKTVDFLVALMRWDEVFQLALDCGRQLAEARQWAQGSKYLNHAVAAAEQRKDLGTNYLLAMSELLGLESVRSRLGLEENLRRIDAFKTALWFVKPEASQAEYLKFELRAFEVEWRSLFVRERLSEALEVASRLRSDIMEHRQLLDSETCGRALCHHALTLKVLGKREECMRAFDEAAEKFPDSISARAERLSNIAAFALPEDPAKSLECYREILRIAEGTGLWFLELIHVHIDVAMAHFLLADYTKAKHSALSGVRTAESNGVPAEEARALNILACCLWADGELKLANKTFERACLASERSMSRRFLWRIRTNRAGTALELGDVDAARSNAQSALRLIIGPRKERFTSMSREPFHVKSRWYAALLGLCRYLDSLEGKSYVDGVVAELDLPRLPEHLKALRTNHFPEEVFGTTTHVHAGRIMITG